MIKMNVMEVIKKRHSYRGKYLSEPIPRNALVKIMEAELMVRVVNLILMQDVY